MSTNQISQTLPQLTEPLVRAGCYPSSEQALKHIVLDFVDRRIAWAQAKVRRLEKKHGQTFAEYTRTLTGQAPPADEDEWMEWESLLDMVEGWRVVKVEIQQSDTSHLWSGTGDHQRANLPESHGGI
ncbi:MAG: hypothetical protein IPK16_21750 [Anaerolineales bacterium]|nr:hypothetical protein [Anaerolineales bacterium]